MSVEVIRLHGEPVGIRINGREFPCEDEINQAIVPKECLTGLQLSDIPDDVAIKPVEAINDHIIEMKNNAELFPFRNGEAFAIVEEMFRRKFWDEDIGLTPYVAALRAAVDEDPRTKEVEFQDDDDYIFLHYEIQITEDVPIIAASELVDATVEALHERADQLAHRRRDGLLKLFDRGSFDDDLRYAMRKPQPVSLVMVDIDHFKPVNDRFGHLVGDEVLRVVARTLSDACDGKCQTPYRYGGEELAVIVTGEATADSVELAEDIRKRVESLRLDHNLKITVSLGVAQVAEDRNGESLIRRADAALYAAKENGRNQVKIDVPTDSKVTALPHHPVGGE